MTSTILYSDTGLAIEAKTEEEMILLKESFTEICALYPAELQETTQADLIWNTLSYSEAFETAKRICHQEAKGTTG